DPVHPTNPLLLVKEAGNAVVLNSYAMRLANINKDTSDPRREIVRDPKTDEPTGVLLESAMALGFAAAPPASQAERLAAIRHASDQLLRWGTTTVADMAVEEEAIRDFQALYKEVTEPLVTTVLCPLVPATH